MKTTLLLFVFPINLRTSEEHLERKSASFYVSLPPLTPSLAVAFIPSLARICTAACCYQIWRSIFKGSLLKFFFEVCIYIPIYSTLTTMKLSLNDFYLQYPFLTPPSRHPSSKITLTIFINFQCGHHLWKETREMAEDWYNGRREDRTTARPFGKCLPPSRHLSQFLRPLVNKIFRVFWPNRHILLPKSRDPGKQANISSVTFHVLPCPLSMERTSGLDRFPLPVMSII